MLSLSAHVPDICPLSLIHILGAGTAGGHIGLHGPTRVLAYSLSLDAARLDEREMANACLLYTSRCV